MHKVGGNLKKHTLTFPNLLAMPSVPATLSKIRFRCPSFSISRMEVSSSSQTSATRSIDVKRLSLKLSTYASSDNDVNQSATLNVLTSGLPFSVESATKTLF